MLNTFYDCYSILTKVYKDKAFFKQALNSTIIEEKNRAKTTKICYGVLDRDEELSFYISSLTNKAPKQAIKTILKISMYCIKYLCSHEYAVTQNAVELTKKLGKSGASGFVNAFLRKFISFNFELPKDTIKNLSVKYSYPEFAIKRLIKDYGDETTEKIISTKENSTWVCFYNENGEKYLQEHGYNFTKTPFYNVFSVENFRRNEDYDKGIYTFQSIGSVAICEVVESGEKLLDCCSAPGGKSVRLSYRFNQVNSLDIHPHRVSLIEDYAFRMNRKNITAQLQDAKVFKEDFVGAFDAVLCDAPCSGLGVVNDNPDIKLNREENSIIELNNEQLSILNNVCKYVKKGGCLYYSTCSILKSENIELIKKFLQNKKDFVIEEINSPLEHLKIDGTLQFLPHISNGVGFFVAKLRRV
ncbi:MAG: 16S rRNA (cytosine(967)-C(5))-methyltransferase RsmB [Clostridia bacterium]|nr:16S rRNA (cytosine(967)-C(5))-methyltransferase RsmB [Clostridia bacterium]